MKTSKGKQTQPELAHVHLGGGKEAGLAFPNRLHLTTELGQLLAPEFSHRMGAVRPQGRRQFRRIDRPKKLGSPGTPGKIRPPEHLQVSSLQLHQESFQLQHAVRHRGADLQGRNGHASPDVAGRGHQDFRAALLGTTDLHAEFRLNFWCRTSQIFQYGLRPTPSLGDGKLLGGRLPPCLGSDPPLEIQIKSQYLSTQPLDPDLSGSKFQVCLHPAGLRLHLLSQRPAHVGVPQPGPGKKRLPWAPRQPVGR